MVGRTTHASGVDHPTLPGELIFSDGNPATAQDGTVLTSDVVNALVEELVGMAEGEGLTPDVEDWTQVRAAIARMIGRHPPLKNRVVNGAFEVWQRQVTFALATVELYTADRFASKADGAGGAGTATVNRQAFAAGQTDVSGEPTYFLRHAQTVAATQSQPYLATRLEGVRWTSERTITVSFWAKGDQAFDVDLALLQDFGPTGSAAVSGGTDTFSVSTSWQRFTYTTQLPDVAGKSIVDGSHLEVQLAMPQSMTFNLDVADLQVELGDEATPVDRRPFGYELLLCQRFYEHSYPYGTYPGAITEEGQSAGSDQNQRARALTTRFRAEKAVTPAMTWYSPNSGTAGLIYWNAADRTVAQVYAVGSSATGYPEIAGSIGAVQPVEAHWTAEAEI